jgi:hypothetical protein
MAHAPARVSALEDRVPLLWDVEARRQLGADEPGDAAEVESDARPEARAERGDVNRQSVKTTGIGGEQRGFDGGKKVRGRKRHVPVDTDGLVVEVHVHSAKVRDQDGIRRLLEPARSRLPRLAHAWIDADYRGKGKERLEYALDVEVEAVNRSPKPPLGKVLRVWTREWFKEERHMDLSKSPERPAFEKLPCRWVAERTYAWISHNQRMSKKDSPGGLREAVSAIAAVALQACCGNRRSSTRLPLEPGPNLAPRCAHRREGPMGL